MKRIIALIAILFSAASLQAQLFGKSDIGIRQGFMVFDAGALNNKNNGNDRISIVNELDRHLNFRRRASLNYGLGLGSIRNLNTDFAKYEHSDFFRIKAGLVLHGAQHHSPRNWSPRRFNPYLVAAYNIDFFNAAYGSVNGSALVSSLKLGGGAVIRLSHAIGLSYEFTHNQRVNPDYRTYFQHSLGIVINMDMKYIPY